MNATSKTTENMIRTGQCVLNLPSVDNVTAVNRLVCLTGTNPVPAGKVARGYTFEKEKFERAGLTTSRQVNGGWTAPENITRQIDQGDTTIVAWDLDGVDGRRAPARAVQHASAGLRAPHLARRRDALFLQ